MTRRPASFYWWNDAVEVARLAAASSGVRYRVYKSSGSSPWRVAPSSPRLVEVTC